MDAEAERSILVMTRQLDALVAVQCELNDEARTSFMRATLGLGQLRRVAMDVEPQMMDLREGVIEEVRRTQATMAEQVRNRPSRTPTKRKPTEHTRLLNASKPI